MRLKVLHKYHLGGEHDCKTAQRLYSERYSVKIVKTGGDRSMRAERYPVPIGIEALCKAVHMAGIATGLPMITINHIRPRKEWKAFEIKHQSASSSEEQRFTF